MNLIPLKNVLLSFADAKGKRRMLFNSGAVGGINTNLVKIFLLSLPFIEYALIFNDTVFNKLGIATAIVAFIIFLSIVMIIVFVVFWKMKKNVIKKITPSWNEYFPGRDLKMVLSSGVTPYSDFFTHLVKILSQNLNEEETKESLLKAFSTMEDENKELIEAMNRDKKLAL